MSGPVAFAVVAGLVAAGIAFALSGGQRPLALVIGGTAAVVVGAVVWWEHRQGG